MTDAKLKSFVDRIERVQEEQDGLADSKRDLYSEVKSAGFNPQALRKVLAERRKKKDAQLEADIDSYKVALGMALVRDEGLSLRAAEKISGASKSSIHRGLSVPEVSQ